MRTDEYAAFCAGLRRLAGVDLDAYKRPQMERRLRTHAERHGAASLTVLLQRLEASPAELDALLDRVTINVSELYRNPEQYEVLRTRVLPALQPAGGVRAWSAGCSYGAEAYTLATLLAATPGAGAYEVTGSDLDRRVLARAERGWFAGADMRQVPQPVRDRYFAPQSGGWQAGPELRRRLRFRREDLLAGPYRTGWDLVLCRNVVIYFTDAARDRVHRGIAAALRPGGFLMVGAAERVADPAAIGLEPVHPFIYRKAA